MKRPEITRMNGFYDQIGYHSATVAAREGRSPSHVSGYAHAEYDRIKLIGQSREFARDNGIYRGMIERMVSYIVGNGFDFQARTDDNELNNKIESLWWDYWKNPEIKNVMSGSRLERMVCRELLTTGDTALIKTKTGKLQHVEAEQIVHTKFRDGIEKDKYGKPLNFYVAGYSRGGRIVTSKAAPYRASDVLYITEPDRPSSIRGVPPCQATFPMLHRINDICDSESIAWQMLARIALSITRDRAAEMAFDESATDETATSNEVADRITELDYALIFHGNPGDEIKGVEHNLPGKDFSQSLLTFLRLLGLPLGLPLEVILLDWTKSNYSQSRAVLEQAYGIFIGWQYLLEEFFLRPAFEWKCQQWMLKGDIPDMDTVPHEWIKPTFPWIDQLKEAQAYGAKLDRGFITHALVCKSLDLEREDVLKVRESEVREAIAIAQKIKDETGVVVPWQIFAGLESDVKTLPVEDENNDTNEPISGDDGE